MFLAASRLEFVPIRSFAIVLQHGSANFRGRWPYSARCAGIALVFVELFQVGLHGRVTLKKHNANGIAWDTRDEILGFLDHAADALVQVRHIDGLLGGQDAKFLCCEAAVPDNLGQHLFRGLAGKAPHGGAEDCPKG